MGWHRDLGWKEGPALGESRECLKWLQESEMCIIDIVTISEFQGAVPWPGRGQSQFPPPLPSLEGLAVSMPSSEPAYPVRLPRERPPPIEIA